MIDAIGRPALAKTVIEGPALTISLIPQPIEEQSVSIYHEVLEALVVATPSPPESTLEMVESDFEHAAQSAHREIGFASPKNVLVFCNVMDLKPEKHLDWTLVRLATGRRLLRISDSEAKLCLEMELQPALPVAAQREKLEAAFRRLLADTSLVAA